MQAHLLEALAVVGGGRGAQQLAHVGVVQQRVAHGRQQQARQAVLHGQPEPVPRRVQPLRQLLHIERTSCTVSDCKDAGCVLDLHGEELIIFIYSICNVVNYGEPLPCHLLREFETLNVPKLNAAL